MITDPVDQIGGNAKLPTGDELTHWNALLEAFNLCDTFRRTDSALKFTWDNRRLPALTEQRIDPANPPQDTGRVLKRLDRVYVDSSLLITHLRTEILSGSELSDHLPVSASFRFGPPPVYTKSNYRMNVTSLQDPMLKTHITDLWVKWQKKHQDSGASALDTLKSCIKRTAKFCQLWGKRKALKRKEKHAKLTLKVHGLLLQLQSNPSNIYTQIKLEAAQTELNAWEGERPRWTQQLLDRRWEEESERSSKLFFNSIKARKKQTSVHALQDEEGNLHTEEGEILQMAAQYFQDILQEPPADPLQQQVSQELLQHVQARLRLSPVLQRLITWEQNAFVPGRQLHSTVLLCNEAIHHAKTEGQDCVFLKIDLKKAFDSLRWDFLYEAMQTMGFGDYFTHLVSTLNSSAASSILFQKKREGGMGLISLQAQSQVFTSKLIRWAHDLGPHPLKAWLKAQFQSIADIRWSSSHITWVSSRSRGAWPSLSPILLHLCKVWQLTAKHLRPLHQLPIQTWQKLSVWGPKTEGVRNVTRVASSGPFATLKAAGIEEIGQITDGSTKTPLLRAVPPHTVITSTLTRSYERILDTTPTFSNPHLRPSDYAITPPTAPCWCIQLMDAAPANNAALQVSHAKAAYRIQVRALLTVDRNTLPQDAQWELAPVLTSAKSQKRVTSKTLLNWEDNLAVLATMQWADKSDFMSAPNSAIRRLITTDKTTVQRRVQKWALSHHFDHTDTTI
ncbi:hypothetical protein R1sor_009644 [Riccia sorocarpa]|uniref:Reverse transcriptase domain-containing protein n=1 Tax=Riccia sorocarpa TaxID=122646 RepID=A0ABD3HVN6_9MARC